MIIQILEFIRKKKVATSQQIAHAFGLDISTLQPILKLLVRKEMIADFSKLGTSKDCQKRCFKCNAC